MEDIEDAEMSQDMIVRERGFYPIKRGEETTVVISKLGNKGDGMARIGGFIVIVPGTKVGERVKVQITKVIKTCAFAKVV